MRFRDGDVIVEPGELIVVPRGVEHCPEALGDCHVVLIEPKTRSTQATSATSARSTSSTGLVRLASRGRGFRVVVLASAGMFGVLGLARPSGALPHGIVLDHSIAGVSLLETRAAVERVLDRGRPEQADLKEHWLIVRYPSAGLEVGYSSRTTLDRVHEQVVFVMTTSPSYRTAGGVGVGSSAGAVRSVHGMTCYEGNQPSACQHGMAPGKTGTAFAFRNGKVWRVTVGVSGIFG